MMTRLSLTTLPLVMLLACDLQGGPMEEAGETIDAVKAGDKLEDVADEAGDVFQQRSDLEKRMDELGDWFDTRAEELGDGTRDADDATRRAFDDLQTRWAKTRDDLDAAGEDVAEEITPRVEALEEEVTGLFDGDGKAQ